MVLDTLGAEQIFVGDAENMTKIISKLTNFGVCVEIGTWVGHSTCILALIAKQLGGTVYTIDTFGGNGSMLEGLFTRDQILSVLDRNLKKADVIDYVHVLEGTSDDAVKCFADGAIDFLFIDGDHRYEQVKKDIANWLPKVRGIMAGHDYDQETYDEQHIHVDCVDKVHHGLIKAVNEAFPDVQHEGRIWYKNLMKTP